jgi:hypothetical protein
MARYAITVSHAAQLGPSNTVITGLLIESDCYGVTIRTDDGKVIDIKAQHICTREWLRPKL